MIIKEKLTATLLNHWYAIDRALAIGRLKKMPVSKERYESLKDFDSMAEIQATELIDDFIAYNIKTFAANIVHIVENDAFFADLENKPTTSRTKANIRTVVQLPHDSKAPVAQLLKALNGPDQDPSVRSVLSMLPRLHEGENNYVLNIDIAYGLKSFYKNFNVLEQDFIKAWNASKILFAISRHVYATVSEADKKEIIEGKAFVNISSPKFSDGLFECDKFFVVETPAAKAQREVLERIEAALKKRIKTVKVSGIQNGSVSYVFDDTTTEPLKVKLDVVTHW